MTHRSMATLVATVAVLACPTTAQESGHSHGDTLDPKRFVTSRSSAVDLPLPEEKDAFFFAVFGDRTGGPPEGVEVLAKAVDEVNLLEPDLVMTVGDLVQGYNQTPEWLEQMREFKGIMNRLLMPWFPVAGNHDVYWRGPGKPRGEHDRNYETNFGPLWYAFRHKRCWFIVLYTDEGDPETGEKDYGKPASNKMSPEQLAWLKETLGKTRNAEHVFVFLHHPRWLKGRYGNDWDRVHGLLAEAGNVSAVFAGHIHRMRHDGERDGIEYVTLATTGGSQAGDIPGAGYLHHYNLVTVRKDRVAIAAVPVGAVFDPRKVTGMVSEECRKLQRQLTVSFGRVISLDDQWGSDSAWALSITNPVRRPIEVTITPDSRDPRWKFTPDHQHVIIEPGKSAAISLRAWHPRERLDSAFYLPTVSVQPDYLGENLRVSLPVASFAVPTARPELTAPTIPQHERFLVLDGRRDHVAVAHGTVPLPQGAFTLEAWLRADAFRDRQGVLGKNETCEYGFVLSRGVPSFQVHLDGSYTSAAAGLENRLETERWYHLAGVFDGRQVSLYIDGARVATASGGGSRTLKNLPLLIGAAVTREGKGVDHFKGALDEVRLSRVARYTGTSFRPQRRLSADAHTLLLLHVDGPRGPWLFDSSPAAAHPARNDVAVGSDH